MANGLSRFTVCYPVSCNVLRILRLFENRQIRLSCIQETTGPNLFGHIDAFRVGEDGPTHQPNEQGKLKIRLLEKLNQPIAHWTKFFVAFASCRISRDQCKLGEKMAMAKIQRPQPDLFCLDRVLKMFLQKSGKTVTKKALELKKVVILIQGSWRIHDVNLIANGSEVAKL